MTPDDLVYELRRLGLRKASPKRLRGWERDELGSTPHANALPILAAALEVAIDDLYETVGEPAGDPLATLRNIRAELVRAGNEEMAEDLRKLIEREQRQQELDARSDELLPA